MLALLLCWFVGYPLARLALPAELRGERALLTPLLGLALLLNVTAALTTTTALTPLTIAAGLAVLALPLNLWLLLRREKRHESRTKHQAAREAEAPQELNTTFASSRLRGFVPTLLAFALGALAFALAVAPPLRWGASLPIGVNWDAAEFYVPLGRALQLASQRDLGTLGRNPLITILTTPPVSGRIHAFSYLHALASTLAGVDPARSYVGMMALVLALQPPAVYVLGRAVGLARAGALLGAALAALGWLPLWVSYNSFSNHLLALPLLPAALGASLVALHTGGWRAVLTGALLTAGLATGYYPAMTAYVVFLAPAGLWLLARAPAGGRLAVLRRGLALAGLALLLSAAAEAFFFFKSGFLQEMADAANGFQVNEFVGLADALGLSATFNREAFVAGTRLVTAGSALALALALAAIVGRRTPTLAALALGAGLYLGYTAARQYHYGFYKGATFALPLLALLVAGGAATLWRAARALPGKRSITRRVAGWVVSGAAALAVGLILALNMITTAAVLARYTAAGPQLWALAEAEVLSLRAEVPPGASLLVVPPPHHREVFNSLISYALLGHELSGRYKTGYNRIDSVDNDPPPEMALLPGAADPGDYGYRTADLRWASADMRLYGRAAGVQYHRPFGQGGRYAQVAPGAPLALRLGAGRIALPGERPPPATAAGPVRVVLALASFGPATLELRSAGASERHALPGGLVQLTTGPLSLPGQLELRVEGAAAYLWWGELCDPAACAAGAIPRDDVFVQVAPLPAPAPNQAAAELRVHTEQLPEGRQKLTAVLALGYRPASGGEWREAGQWVFFPSGEALRFDLDLARLQAALSAAGQPRDIVGAPPPPQDGSYQLTLLLANDARIVYGTKLASWRRENGAASQTAVEGVDFDVVPLPAPATVRDAPLADGSLRLRGYSLPRTRLRPGETLELALVWQSLAKIKGDLSAHVVLADAQGRTLAETTLALGAPEHGTHTWQEGEVSEQRFALVVPAGTPPGGLTLAAELRDAQGRTLPFANVPARLPLAELTVTE